MSDLPTHSWPRTRIEAHHLPPRNVRDRSTLHRDTALLCLLLIQGSQAPRQPTTTTISCGSCSTSYHHSSAFIDSGDLPDRLPGPPLAAVAVRAGVVFPVARPGGLSAGESGFALVIIRKLSRFDMGYPLRTGPGEGLENGSRQPKTMGGLSGGPTERRDGHSNGPRPSPLPQTTMASVLPGRPLPHPKAEPETMPPGG